MRKVNSVPAALVAQPGGHAASRHASWWSMEKEVRRTRTEEDGTHLLDAHSGECLLQLLVVAHKLVLVLQVPVHLGHADHVGVQRIHQLARHCAVASLRSSTGGTGPTVSASRSRTGANRQHALRAVHGAAMRQHSYDSD